MPASRLERAYSHLRTPLFRNGYALVANTALSSGLGAVFWIVAARLYPTEEVGVNAALISAMVFLAKLAQVNMVNGLNRFVPGAGARTGRLIAVAYAVAAPLGAVLAIGFVAGLGVWAPRLGVVRSNPVILVGFVAAVMAWTVFVLQDAALTGLRRATWIPVENTAYGVTKIGLLAVFAAAAPAVGIFAAWTVPLVFVLVPMNLLIFKRAVPRHLAVARPSGSGFDGGTVARFAAADFTASIGWLATIHLLPVIVLGLAGEEASAYFYLSWVIASALFEVSRNTGMSLVTEASLEIGELAAYSRKVLLQTGAIVVPVALGFIVFAPWVLAIFGAEYSAQGSGVLRLMVAAAIPNIVVSLYVAMLRVQRRMRALFALYAALGAGVLTTSVLLIGRIGIIAVGMAWLVTLSLIATVLLATELRGVWFSRLDRRIQGAGSEASAERPIREREQAPGRGGVVTLGRGPAPPLPSIVVAGVPKAGTTSLFEALAAHSQVCGSAVKETQWLRPILDGEPPPPLEDYLRHFEVRPGHRYLLEATPEYVYGGERLIGTLRDLLGEVRVIVVLRDPRSRLRSFFLDKKANLKLDPRLTYEEYVAACAAVPAAERLHRRNSAFMGVEGSRYDRYLPLWLTEFGDSLRVLFFDDLVADPAAVLDDLARWLGLDPDGFAAALERHNRTVRLRSAFLHRLAVRVAGRLTSHPRLHRATRSLYYRVNGATPDADATADPDLEQRLEVMFEPHNEQLARELVRHGYHDLPEWLALGAGRAAARQGGSRA